MLRTGIVVGLAYALWRAWRARVPARGEDDLAWESAPFPFPPVPRPSVPTPRVEPFVEPDAGGSCPASHPVKAKLASGIYHVPGGANFDRTKADRCYVDPSAAEADGLRAAKH